MIQRPFDVRLVYMRNVGRMNAPAVMERTARTMRVWAVDADAAREIARERYNAYVVGVHESHG